MIMYHNCEHEIDDETKIFIEGVGFCGNCKYCGAKVVQSRRKPVKPRTKPKMSKKQRLKERRAT